MNNLLQTLFLVLLAITVFCASCTVVEPPSKDFSSLLNQPKVDTNSLLNFMGGYERKLRERDCIRYVYQNGKSTTVIDTPYVVSPLYFFPDGLIAYDSGISHDSLMYQAWISNYPKQAKGMRYWGVYKLKGDTVNAIIYREYRGKPGSGRHQYRQTHYQGILEKDVIRQWQMVPPFPKADKRLNETMLKNEPVDLYFKVIPERALIDPKDAWINEFRIQK